VKIPLSSRTDANVGQNSCDYSLFIYATKDYSSGSTSSAAAMYSIVVAVSFLLIIVTLCLYDWLIQQRNSKTLKALVRSHAFVASLFPSNVRSSLLGGDDTGEASNPIEPRRNHRSVKRYLEDGTVQDEEQLGCGGAPYLNYAVRNRKEWECKEKAIVYEMVEKVSKTLVQNQECSRDIVEEATKPQERNNVELERGESCNGGIVDATSDSDDEWIDL